MLGGLHAGLLPRPASNSTSTSLLDIYRQSRERLERSNLDRGKAVAIQFLERSFLPMAPCRFFAQGFCARGTTCYFDHEQKVSRTKTPWRPSPDAPAFQLPTRALRLDANPPEIADPPSICHFFLLKKCKNGQACRFNHPSSVGDDPQRSVPRPPPIPGQPSLPITTDANPLVPTDETVSRTFGSTTVTFGSGAAVQQVRVTSDFSAIQISGLPVTTRAPEVQALLAGHGYTVEMDTIRVKIIGDEMAVASVTVPDPRFAETTVKGMSNGLAQDKSSKITVRTKAVLGEDGGALNRFEMRSVSCSWYKPSRVAWLHYGRLDLASRAVKRLDGRKVHGRNIDCRIQDNSPICGYNSKSVISIQIGNLDVSTKEDDLAKFLTGCLPQKYVFGKSSYSTSHDQGASLVKELLLRTGSLESFEMNAALNSNRVKALAKFCHGEHAKKAMVTLSGSKVSQFGNSKLFVNQLISVKFTILAEMYSAIQADVDELREHSLATSSVHISNYQPSEPSQRFITVRIYGEETKSVARVKSAFEVMVSGHAVKDNDQILWDGYFTSPQSLLYLKELHQQYGVFVYRDSRKSCLAMYGPAEQQEVVQREICRKLKELAFQEHTITLTGELQLLALHGGFRRIINTLGKDKASLDVRLRPMTITIHGSAEDLQTAMLLLKGDGGSAVQSEETGSDNSDCAICWTTPDEPYSTPCGHVYCSDCFAGQCASVADTDLPISCLGDSANCKQILPLSALQKALKPDDFNSLLQKSFKMHVQSNPLQFQYCPTPDCPEVYKASIDAHVVTCSACFSQTCSSCHVLSHDGLTCAENKDLQGEGNKAFKKWKQENDVKDCPKCSMPIEKTYGCNHMECKACGVHFCWFCMAFFDTGPETYGHMSAEHARMY